MEHTSAASLIEAIPAPILLIGPDERILHGNGAARQLFGGRIAGRHYVTVLRQPSLLDAIESVLSDRIERAEADFTDAGPGRERVYRAHAARVALPAGPALVLTFVDRTEVQDAGAMRRDFVANVSHELRTPLTALVGFIETLRGAARDDPVARDRFLGIMEREAGRMNRLVKDLLSLSRVESEERVRPRARVDAAALVRSAVSSLKPLAENARVTIGIEGDEGPAAIPGDSDQLMQVVTNLLENAIKYGGKGGRISVRLDRLDPAPPLRAPGIAIAVTDFGEGIDPIHVPRLTERFYRVDAHRSREQGGTGLGLAIVKHIVNRHRGRLRIDSTPGGGSTFTVYLPLD